MQKTLQLPPPPQCRVLAHAPKSAAADVLQRLYVPSLQCSHSVTGVDNNPLHLSPGTRKWQLTLPASGVAAPVGEGLGSGRSRVEGEVLRWTYSARESPLNRSLSKTRSAERLGPGFLCPKRVREVLCTNGMPGASGIRPACAGHSGRVAGASAHASCAELALENDLVPGQRRASAGIKHLRFGVRLDWYAERRAARCPRSSAEPSTRVQSRVSSAAHWTGRDSAP